MWRKGNILIACLFLFTGFILWALLCDNYRNINAYQYIGLCDYFVCALRIDLRGFRWLHLCLKNKHRKKLLPLWCHHFGLRMLEFILPAPVERYHLCIFFAHITLCGKIHYWIVGNPIMPLVVRHQSGGSSDKWRHHRRSI